MDDPTTERTIAEKTVTQKTEIEGKKEEKTTMERTSTETTTKENSVKKQIVQTATLLITAPAMYEFISKMAAYNNLEAQKLLDSIMRRAEEERRKYE